MTRKLYEEQSVQKLANSIRNANGETDKYKIAEFASKVRPWTPRAVAFDSSNWDDGYKMLKYLNTDELESVDEMFMGGQPYEFYYSDATKIFSQNNKIKSARKTFSGNRLQTMRAKRDGELEPEPTIVINLPECEDVSGMFIGTAIGDMGNMTFNLPKLKNASRMFMNYNWFSIGDNHPVSEWNMPDGVIMDEMFFKEKNAQGPRPSIAFGNNRIAPSSCYRMMSGTSMNEPRYLNFEHFDFYLCSNFEEMFANSTSNPGMHITLKKLQQVPNNANFKNMFKDMHGGMCDFSFMKDIICDSPYDVNGMFLIDESIGYGMPYEINISGIKLSNLKVKLTELLPSYIDGSYVIVGSESDKNILQTLYANSGWKNVIRIGE